MVNVRRLLWAVLIGALVTMLLMLYLNSQVPKGAQPATTSPAGKPGKPASSAPAATASPRTSRSATVATASRPASASASAPGSTSAPAEWSIMEYPEREVMLGSLDQDSGYKLQVQTIGRGAAVKTIKLTDYFFTVADKKRHERDPAGYDEALKTDPKLRGHFSILNPVGLDPADTVYPLATQQIGLPALWGGATADLTWWLEKAGQVKVRWQAGEMKADADGTQRVTWTAQINHNRQPFVKIDKTYSLKKGSYSVGLDVTVTSLVAKTEVKLTQFGPTGVPREDLQADRRVLAYGHYAKGALEVAKVPIGEAARMRPGMSSAWAVGRSDGTNPVAWIGVSDKFFASIIYIQPENPASLADPEALAEFFRAAMPESPESQTFVTGMNLGTYEIDPAKPLVLKMDVFAGPKKRELFDGSELYQKLRYKDTLDFGSCCTWAPLTLGMMWLLDALHLATFRNYGLAIILLVILVRLVLHPLTKKGQVSMMRMQKLQPEMTKLREKYKDDKAKLNEEMMKLYKQQGASPILGCLPMVLQMPIWIALWTGLSAAVELRQAAFLPVWITDLAAPDDLVSFGTVIHVPLIDSMVGPIRGLNLLPILWAVAMVITQKMTPSPATMDQQARSQRRMMYFMSGFFILLFYNGPSGLTLYLVISTFAQAAEQVVIRKHIQQRQAEAAAVETQVEMPGSFRGHKPKRPKGPFRF